MKKLYHKGNNQVHPSPSQTIIDHQFSLSYLPAAILTLAAALSSQDKEVLAYLLSSSSSSTLFHFDYLSNKSSKNNQSHPPSFSCYCFTCYTYYWALWDSSPNRQLIHQIIDAFEDNLVSHKKNKKKHPLTKREKRKNNNNNKGILSLDDCKIKDNLKVIDEGVKGSNGFVRVNPEFGRVDSVQEVDGQLCDEISGDDKQGSNVRKIVSFIGERIWGSVWG